MLDELHVQNLGVIEEVKLNLEGGMTALTGETGAGKTLLVEALELLAGVRADISLLRAGAKEALVEGHFVLNDEEWILARSLGGTSGTKQRSVAWVNNRMVPVASLAKTASNCVELHGQHTHQALLTPEAQRSALDEFCGIDTTPLHKAVAGLKDVKRALSELGGDESERLREMDILRYQINEIEAAQITDPFEDIKLEEQEDTLADVVNAKESAQIVLSQLGGDGSDVPGGSGPSGMFGDNFDVLSITSQAVKLLEKHPALVSISQRFTAVQAELADVMSELRETTEQLIDDPEMLEKLRTRRQMLKELCKKYGPVLSAGSASGSYFGKGSDLAPVVEFEKKAKARLLELESASTTAAELDQQRVALEDEVNKLLVQLRTQRVNGAAKFGETVMNHLSKLAMPKAILQVRVGQSADDVVFLLGVNSGEPLLPLSKVASGGELSRCMLAIRLALMEAADYGTTLADEVKVGSRQINGASTGKTVGTESTSDIVGPGPTGKTLIFDEVDAGIGGQAALAVGKALAILARNYQVLVVTHLPQVAAFADHQISVEKHEQKGRTISQVTHLDSSQRVIELARMLSGQPHSKAAQQHALDLIQSCQGDFLRR